MKALDAVILFVEGKMTPDEFRNHLYENIEFEKLLDDNSEIPPNTYIPYSTYHYLLELNLDDPGGVLNAQVALEEYLRRKKIVFENSDEHRRVYNLLLDAQPRYLDIETDFLKKNYLDKAPKSNSETEIKKWIRNKLKKDFRYLKKPPKWIQSPEWPIRNGKPLTFMGQLAVDNYFHDDAQIYVFHDVEKNVFETIMQVH